MSHHLSYGNILKTLLGATLLWLSLGVDADDRKQRFVDNPDQKDQTQALIVDLDDDRDSGIVCNAFNNSPTYSHPSRHLSPTVEEVLAPATCPYQIRAPPRLA